MHYHKRNIPLDWVKQLNLTIKISATRLNHTHQKYKQEQNPGTGGTQRIEARRTQGSFKRSKSTETERRSHTDQGRSSHRIPE